MGCLCRRAGANFRDFPFAAANDTLKDFRERSAPSKKAAQSRQQALIIAFGGQTAIKLTQFLNDQGIKISGTSAEGIDLAEDHERFDALLEKFRIKRPRGFGVNTLKEALNAAETLGYPVLLRPSYVIGGQNMQIVHSSDEVRVYMERILSQGISNPVLVDINHLRESRRKLKFAKMQGTGDDLTVNYTKEHILLTGDAVLVYSGVSEY